MSRRGHSRRMLGGARAFLPTILSGLKLWLRSDMGIVLNGSDVVSWADQSGTGDSNKDMVTPSSSQRPTYSASDASYNNKPTLSFDAGAVDYMQSLVWASPQTAPWTVYIVGHFGAFSATQDFCDLDNAAFTLVRRSASTTLALNAGVTLSGTASGLESPLIFCGVGNGASSSIYKSSTTAFASGNAGTNQLERVTLGINRAGGGAMGGKCAEMIIYQGAHSVGTIAQVMNYLSARYGITLS